MNFKKFVSRIFRLFTSKFFKQFISSFCQFSNPKTLSWFFRKLYLDFFSIENFIRRCTQSNQGIIMNECKFIRLNYIATDFATFFKRFAVIQIGICLVTANCIRKKRNFSLQVKLNCNMTCEETISSFGLILWNASV